DVLDDEDMGPLDGERRREGHLGQELGFARGDDLEEADLRRQPDLAGEIGHEDEGALEDPEQGDLLAAIELGDLAPEGADALGNLLFGLEDLAGHVHRVSLVRTSTRLVAGVILNRSSMRCPTTQAILSPDRTSGIRPRSSTGTFRSMRNDFRRRVPGAPWG